MGDVFEDRFMRNIVINAGLDRIARGENLEESAREVFDEMTMRFHTIDMLEFLNRTRGYSEWLNDAYKVANSDKLGCYRIIRQPFDKRRKGFLTFIKPSHSVRFDYQWKPGLEQRIQETTRIGAALLSGSFLGSGGASEDESNLMSMALRGEGMFRERFCQREYTLVTARSGKIREVRVEPAGIFLFSYNKSDKKRIYQIPQA